MRNPEQYYRQQGYEANKALYSRLIDNPYTQGFEQHTWWAEGWMEYARQAAIPLIERMAS